MNRVAALFLLATAVTAWECSNDLSCQLNGKCISGKCVCEAAWKGLNCSEVALLPTTDKAGIKLKVNSTWGGSVIKDNSGKYHMYAAYLDKSCGITSWRRNSAIVHAVSDTIDGTYEIKDTPVGVWSHNPSMAVAKDGTLLMYHIGNGTNVHGFETCNGDALCCENGASPCGFQRCAPPCNCNISSEVNDDLNTFYLHYATHPSGPWKLANVDIPITGGNNPAPWVHPNGTVYVVFNNDNMLLVKADNWQGPYENVTTGACGGGEDPFIWTDTNGHWHCLFHASPYSNLSIAGGHAFSVDGFDWFVSETAAYTGTYVDYLESDGSIRKYPIAKRERPHLIFENGEPIALTNGVVLRTPGANDSSAWHWASYNPFPGFHDRSWTHLQLINRK